MLLFNKLQSNETTQKRESTVWLQLTNYSVSRRSVLPHSFSIPLVETKISFMAGRRLKNKSKKFSTIALRNNATSLKSHSISVTVCLWVMFFSQKRHYRMKIESAVRTSFMLLKSVIDTDHRRVYNVFKNWLNSEKPMLVTTSGSADWSSVGSYIFIFLRNSIDRFYISWSILMTEEKTGVNSWRAPHTNNVIFLELEPQL